MLLRSDILFSIGFREVPTEPLWHVLQVVFVPLDVEADGLQGLSQSPLAWPYSQILEEELHLQEHPTITQELCLYPQLDNYTWLYLMEVTQYIYTPIST